MRKTIFKNLIATILFSSIFVILSVWVFVWFALRVWDMPFDIQVAKSRAAALDMERKEARAMSILFEERREAIERFSKFFVNYREPVGFIETLEDLARKTGVILAIDLALGAPGANELPLRLNIEGSERNVLRYLRLLELLPYQILVEDIGFQSVLSAPDVSLASHRLQLSIRVSTLSPHLPRNPHSLL